MNWIKSSITIVKYDQMYEHTNNPINIELCITYLKEDSKTIAFYFDGNSGSSPNIVRWRFQSEEQTDKTVEYIETLLNIKMI